MTFLQSKLQEKNKGMCVHVPTGPLSWGRTAQKSSIANVLNSQNKLFKL